MRRTSPGVHRPFRVPFVPLVPLAGIFFCLVMMLSLPSENWIRLFVWLLIGMAIYFFYGRHRSALRKKNDTV
jgi:APA family basic amino acid/polyamine antiporter